jgi:hypothetical protein
VYVYPTQVYVNPYPMCMSTQVCAGSLALMDAGVPILGHVAGISVGLILEENAAGEVGILPHPTSQ